LKRKQITVVEVECTLKRVGEEIEAREGREMTCPFEGQIEDFIIGLTEGLKVMLHETICNDKF